MDNNTPQNNPFPPNPQSTPPVNPFAAPADAPEQPAPVSSPIGETPQPPKKPKKKLVIILASVIGALLIAGGVAAAVYVSNQPTEADYADAKTILKEIEDRTEEFATKAQASASVVTSKNVLGKQVAQSQIFANELKSSLASLQASRDKLANHKVLNDLVFKQQYDEFIARSDKAIAKGSNIAESSPIATKVMFECSDNNLLNNIDSVIASLDNLMASLTNSGGAFNPDTLVPNFDNDPVNIACKKAVEAANLPLKDEAMSGIVEVFGTTIPDTRARLVKVVAEYKSNPSGYSAFAKKEHDESVARYTTIVKDIGAKDTKTWEEADFTKQLENMSKQADEKSK